MFKCITELINSVVSCALYFQPIGFYCAGLCPRGPIATCPREPLMPVSQASHQSIQLHVAGLLCPSHQMPPHALQAMHGLVCVSGVLAPQKRPFVDGNSPGRQQCEPIACHPGTDRGADFTPRVSGGGF